ncbi:MAG: AhpC/TSA family protein [Acidobacteriota bacterium]
MTAEDSAYPSPLFIHLGNEQQGEDFFQRFWPEARAVADPEKALYRGFQLPRGGLGQLLGPAVWKPGAKALLRGITAGVPVGDPAQLPGYFLFVDAELRWSYRPRTSADHPDFQELGELAASL